MCSAFVIIWALPWRATANTTTQKRLLATGSEAQANNNLGVIYERKGDLVHATEAYQTAVSIDPALNEAKRNLDRVKKQEPSPRRTMKRYLFAALLIAACAPPPPLGNATKKAFDAQAKSGQRPDGASHLKYSGGAQDIRY